MPRVPPDRPAADGAFQDLPVTDGERAFIRRRLAEIPAEDPGIAWEELRDYRRKRID